MTGQDLDKQVDALAEQVTLGNLSRADFDQKRADLILAYNLLNFKSYSKARQVQMLAAAATRLQGLV